MPKRKSWLGRNVYSYLDDEDLSDDRHITVYPAIDYCSDGTRVTFCDGRTVDVDIIILATGYRQYFPFLQSMKKRDMKEKKNEMKGKMQASQDGDGHSFGDGDDDDLLPEEHNICSTAHPSLSFMGFVRPNVGAIPPIAEMQCMWWISRLAGKNRPFQPRSTELYVPFVFTRKPEISC